jgi:hypothetical protein
VLSIYFSILYIQFLTEVALSLVSEIDSSGGRQIEKWISEGMTIDFSKNDHNSVKKAADEE